MGRAARQQPIEERETAYSDAIKRSFRHVREAARQLKAKRSRIKKVLRRLEEGGAASLPTLPRGWEVPYVEALLERSWSLRREDPKQMVDLAEMARLGMLKVRSSACEPSLVADLYCRVWIELGNAYRIADRFEEAERAFGNAAQHYLQGSQDKLQLARLYEVQASLHRSRREFPAATRYLNLAYTIYRRNGERQLAGRTLISIAVSTGYSGNPEKAIRHIQRGLAMIDQDEDLELVATATHNRLWFLVDCGHFDEARKELFLNRFRYTAAGRLVLIKLAWLEARIDAGLGKLSRAEAGFSKVRKDFVEVAQHYDSALATLDLAAIVLKSHRMEETRELVFEAVGVFLAIGVHRQASSAVLFLRETFEMRVATLGVLEEVTAFLRRAQHDRNARFVPSS